MMYESWVPDLKNERILVTGAGGVLGSSLLNLLQKHNVAHFAPTRRDCNLLDAERTKQLWKEYEPTMVVHLAGWVAGVQGNLSFAGQAFFENSSINLNVIEASRLAFVRKLVVAGTTAIYSDQAPLPISEHHVWNGAPHGSEAAYGHAKRAMLAQLDAYYQQYGMKFGYMICTNLYGPNDRFDEKYGHVVPSLVARFHHAVQTRQPQITIWGDGTPTRDFLFSQDAANAFLTVAAQGQGTFNTATGKAITIRQLVEVLKETSGYEGDVVWDTTKPKGQQTRSYDVGKLQELNWKPHTELRDGIAMTLHWYTKHYRTVRR